MCAIAILRYARIMKISESLRNHIATSFHISRAKALRVCYWLKRLHEDQSLVHGDVGIVPYQTSAEPIRSLIVTVDTKDKAVGCAQCGEWAADSGGKLQKGFRAVILVPKYQPHELRDLNLYPAVLYCLDCWNKDREYYLWAYELDRSETDEREAEAKAKEQPTGSD